MKRMSWIIIFVFSILALSTLPIKADQWFKVAPHNHTDNSDGLRNFQGLVETTKSFGFDTLIVSDHVEKIYQKKGFAAFLKECQADYDDLTVISGTEVTAKTSHTVVFGSLTTKVMSKLNQTQTVSKIIEVARQNDLLAVAAHPFDLAYLYDRTGADDINGIEFFNGLVVDYAKTFAWYRQMLADNKNIFSWAGIDSHSAADPNDSERWQRQTQVYARSNSFADICIALRQGHTIASRRGYRLDDLNPIPGFEVQAIQPRFKFKVASLLPADMNDKINLYRDNKVIKSWSIPIGARSKSIDFLDENCPAGSHTYFIEVASALVTSPIRLEVEDQPKTAKAKKNDGLLKNIINKIKDKIPEIGGINVSDIFGSDSEDTISEDSEVEKTESTSENRNEDLLIRPKEAKQVTHVPIVLGKTRSEVEDILGDSTLLEGVKDDTYYWRPQGLPDNEYYYHYYPSKHYDTIVSFFPFHEILDNYMVAQNIVHSFIVEFADREREVMPTTPNKFQPSKYLRPSQVVPAEILKTKPFGVYTASRALTNTNTLVVIWYVNNKTYVLLLCDSPNRPLFNTLEPSKWVTKYTANKNTFDLNHGYVYHFVVVDKIVKLQECYPITGGPKYYIIDIDEPSHSGFACFPFDK